MQGKVALEAHFGIPETMQDSAGFVPEDYRVDLIEEFPQHAPGVAPDGRNMKERWRSHSFNFTLGRACTSTRAAAME